MLLQELCGRLLVLILRILTLSLGSTCRYQCPFTDEASSGQMAPTQYGLPNSLTRTSSPPASLYSYP